MEGTISIGCGELASVKVLMELIADFSQQYPRAVFNVYTANADQIKNRTHNGLTDVGLQVQAVPVRQMKW